MSARLPLKINFQSHARVLLLIAAIALFSLLAFYETFRNYELFCYDVLSNIRCLVSVKPRQDIIIIEISDDTLHNLGAWPLPRDFHASLVDILREFKARMIVFDIFFSEPTDYDEIFASSLKEAGNVYLPWVYDIDSRQDHSSRFPEVRRVINNVRVLDAAAHGAGHINTFVDSDGKIRSIPLFIDHRHQRIPHLALRLACDALGLNTERVSLRAREVVIDNQLRLPVTFSNSFLVNYPGTWASTFTHFSYYDILKSYKDLVEGGVPSIDLTTLKDKICIIGLTASGTPEIRATPLEASYPLVGLQASVVNSILQRQFIRKIAPFASVVIVVASFLFALIVSLRCRPLKALAVIAGGILLYGIIATLLFVVWGMWCDIFLVVATTVIVYGLMTIATFLEEIKRRELLEKELRIASDIQKSFLPKEIHQFHSLVIASLMQPAKFVAGDLYDIVTLDEGRLGVFVGDVSGKGVPASLTMAQTVSLFRVFARQYKDPAAVLMHLNAELRTILTGRFVTGVYLVVDVPARLIYVANAGHQAVLSWSVYRDTVVELFPNAGLPLGVVESTSYESFQRPITKGEKFLLYTDGVSEARNKKEEEFGLGRLKNLLIQYRGLQADEIVAFLKKTVVDFQQGRSQHDDITMLLLDCSSML